MSIHEFVRNPIIISLVATLIVAGAGGTAYYLATHQPIGKPDLELHAKFPVGFDRQTVEPKALGFDGRSRCTGLLSLVDHRWTHDGIRYTDPPTAEDVMHAQTLKGTDYRYVGSATTPRKAFSEEFDASTDLGLCEFEYDGYIWTTTTQAENVNPIEIPDRAGVAYQHVRTRAYLGGNDDGSTTFMLTGTTETPSKVALQYFVYPAGTAKRTALATSGVASVALQEGRDFSIPFTIEAQPFAKAELILVPLRIVESGNESVPYAFSEGALQLSSLTRLEVTGAQAIVGATEDIPGPAASIAGNAYGGRILHGKSLRDVHIAAERIAASEKLEGVSNAAFLIHKAFEPKAKPGTGHLVQSLPKQTLQSKVVVEVTEASALTRLQSSYVWQAQRQEARFIVGMTQTSMLTASQASGVTASVTQIGAGGAKVVEAIGRGSTAEIALVAAKAGLDGRGHALNLAETLAPVSSSREFIAPAQRYLLAAGALAAGWEWFQATQATDVRDQLIHTVRAARVVAETLFSMSPGGAIVVASINVAELAFKQLLPEDWRETVERGFNTVVLGRVSGTNARQAFEAVRPDLEDMAAFYDAGYLEPRYDKPKQTPGPPGTTLLAALLLLAIAIRRKNQP